MPNLKRTTQIAIFSGVLLLMGAPEPVQALGPLVAVASSGKKGFSTTVRKRCGGKTYRGQSNCTGLAFLFDPPADGITEVGLEFHYDPQLWAFRPGLSGFLCEFTQNGGCPSVLQLAGTVEVESLDEVDFAVGDALPGASVSLVDDAINGVITLEYLMGAPLSATGEQNFLALFFESTQPFPDVSLISFFEDAGTYDFTSAQARCVTTTGTCSSEHPIAGINFTVPLPSTGALFGLALAGLAVGGRRRRFTRALA